MIREGKILGIIQHRVQKEVDYLLMELYNTIEQRWGELGVRYPEDEDSPHLALLPNGKALEIAIQVKVEAVDTDDPT